jgi:thymidylate synthase (FAD)
MKTEVKLKYKTVSIEDFRESLQQIVDYVARVSNPSAEVRKSDKLIRYLIEHKHWSPFEMVNCVLEIETTRDIARQLLRHRSFCFQEFSQRYSATETTMGVRETRLQDWQNRQNSLECDDAEIEMFFTEAQKQIMSLSFRLYDQVLKKGVAKEQARVLLPEGLTRTKLFCNGTLRSWMHYIELRTKPDTQKEHRELAIACAQAIEPEFPFIKEFVYND